MADEIPEDDEQDEEAEPVIIRDYDISELASPTFERHEEPKRYA